MGGHRRLSRLHGDADGPRCGYRDLRTAAVGDACTAGDACVPVGQGSERSCRIAAPCGADIDEPGCGCGAQPAPGAALFLALALLLGRRHRLARRRRTS